MSRALRQEGGYSYTAATDYTPRRDGFAVVTAFADALPAKQDAVLGGFVDVLAALQAGRIAQGDLDAVRARADATLTAHDAAVRRLPGAAEDLLAHRAPRGFDELRSELWAITPQHLYGVALEAAGTALLQAPAGHSADWAGYAQAPTGSSYAVTGTTFAPQRRGGPSLIVGSEGVSVTAGEQTATVLYRACAAVLNWPDGGRRLIGHDGLCVDVEPGLNGIDAHTMATIDAAVHPSAVVRLPPRQRQPRPEAGGGEGTGSSAKAAPATAYRRPDRAARRLRSPRGTVVPAGARLHRLRLLGPGDRHRRMGGGRRLPLGRRRTAGLARRTGPAGHPARLRQGADGRADGRPGGQRGSTAAARPVV